MKNSRSSGALSPSLFDELGIEHKKGKKIQWIYYSDPGKIFDIHNYEYDGDLLIRESNDSDDGYNYRTWEYEYYDDGTLAKKTDIYYGKIREIKYYDGEWRIVKEELYSEDGNISQWTEYMYGEDFSEVISFDDDGSIDLSGTKANNDPSIITPEREY